MKKFCDKENAFNRLIALFICKLVDEIQKNDDDVVEFQYKMGETYESLQDRLQRLHQEGMEKFMREEIYYIPDDYAERLFANRLNAKNRKAAIEDLQNTIRILKFYSNNDFAFKDVHNEQLFYQNGKVLVEVVELFQGYRIVYPSKQQFLGDLFEQLLNKGFKQNEGQFFTPMPITRFIWDCLPLEKIIVSKSGFKFPKVIDYACGAGHFLTEGIEAINEFFQYHGKAKRIDNNAWVEHSIFVVEKDYRLARVAKVSLYMNGAGLGNIKFGDGLESYPEEEIKDGSFDILVANPPYSVSGFKMHLKVKDDAFELLKRNLISNDAGEIETLFVERVSQLLKPCGIAAIILPSSILSNKSGSYIGAREILLQNFYLHGIVQFGNKTFGATPTNTVVLFLEKYDEPPKRKEIIKDSVEAILSGKIDEDWNDKEIFKAYLEKINVEEKLYKSFVAETISVDKLKSNEYFVQYVEWFEKDKSQKKTSYQRDLLKAIKEKEWEKIFYFSLVYNQKTVVVSAPTDNNEQKLFLGYDWSNRKGAEGIQIIQPGGMLYNDQNRYASNTLAAALQSSFSERNVLLSENLEKYHSILRTQDMIDFSSVAFDKVVIPSVKGGTTVACKYPAKNVEKLLMDISGNKTKIEQNEILSEGKYPVITQETDKIISGYTNNPNYISDLPVIVFGDHSCTFKYIDFPFIRGADGTQLLKVNEEEIVAKFLYYYLSSIRIENADKYERHFKYLKTTKIPIPPLGIQQQIVSECEKFDEEHKQCNMYIKDYRKKIAKVANSITGTTKKLGEICEINAESIDPTRTPDKEFTYIDIDSVENGEGVFRLDKKIKGANAPSRAKRFAKENSVIISTVRPNLRGFAFVEREIKDSVYSTGFAILKSLDEKKLNNKLIYFLFMYSEKLMGQMIAAMPKGSYPSINRDDIKNFTIPVPPLSEQKQIVSEIEQYEKQIAQAKAIMAECPTKKKAILKKYLE